MSPLSLLLLETLTVAGLLLVLFQVHGRLGWVPLFVSLGSFQLGGVVATLSLHIGSTPRRHLDQVAVVLFVATLISVLLVYVRSGSDRVRELIHGLFLASLALGLVLAVCGRPLEVSSALGPLPRLGPVLRDLALLGVGSVVLLLDMLLIVIAYGILSRHLPRSFFLRVFASTTLVLSVDALLVVSLAAIGVAPRGASRPDLAASLLVALLLSAIFAFHLRLLRRAELETELEVAARRSLFGVLTSRRGDGRLQALVVRDPLTGLFNRGFFDEVLPLEVARSSRSGHPTSLLLLDLDQFKLVNDRFGHPEGDRVLKEMAAALATSIRQADAPCRIGGEEFAVVLPHAAEAAAVQLATRIRERLRARVEKAKPPLAGGRVTVTIGIATFPAEADCAEALVELADRRLYQGKEKGRDCIVGGTSRPGKMRRFIDTD